MEVLGYSPGPSPYLQSTVDALAEAAGRPNWASLEDIDVPLHQHALSICIDHASQDLLLNLAPDPDSRALAHSTALPHAGDWLNVVPSPSLGLHLHDQEFRSCLRYWLGLPLYPDNFSCP